jgi:hypothetical protein
MTGVAARAGAVAAVARVGAAAGIVGPAVFTSAWIVSSWRQIGHPAADLQISGLAAEDARDPWIMITGFLVLGGCGVAFGASLRERFVDRGRLVDRERLVDRGRLGRRAGSAPGLIQAAGILTIAAGLLRRDHVLLTAGDVSWHNHAHDVVSALIYADLVLAQALLAARFGGDATEHGWRAWRPWLLASAGVTAALLIAYAADTSGPLAGIVQRAAVTVPLAAMAAIAARLVRTPGG